MVRSCYAGDAILLVFVIPERERIVYRAVGGLRILCANENFFYANYTSYRSVFIKSTEEQRVMVSLLRAGATTSETDLSLPGMFTLDRLKLDKLAQGEIKQVHLKGRCSSFWQPTFDKSLASRWSCISTPSLLLVCLSCVMLGGFAAEHTFAAQSPNFVVVLADDCTHRDLGCYGGQAKTPNIDQLATEGMRMTRCFQTAPMCSPTRHNLYTGQYPIKTGAYPNHTQTFDHIRNVTHFLQPSGYRLALSGKVHVGPRSLFPFQYSAKGNNPDMDAIDSLMKDCKREGQPFCLFACSNEPHTPWNKGDASQYPPDRVELPPYLPDTQAIREGFSRYLAEITYFDDQVGQLLALLEKHELNSNTVVVVLSEQGNSMPFAKWTCYDSGLQSAMIVRWPGQVEAGSVTEAMVEYVDVLPTLMEIAGVQDREGVLDGRSFLPVLRGEANQHKSHVFGEMTTRGIINGNDCYPIRSVRSETHKLIWNLKHDQPFTNACVSSREFESLVLAAEAGNEQASLAVNRYQNRPEFELYDLMDDPLEMNDLSEDPSKKLLIAQLKAKLDQWMESQGDEGVATEMRANQHKVKAEPKRGAQQRGSQQRGNKKPKAD